MGTTQSSPLNGEPLLEAEAPASNITTARAPAAASNGSAGGDDSNVVASTSTRIRRSNRQRTETNFLSPTFIPMKRKGRDNHYYKDDDDDDSDQEGGVVETSPILPHAYVQRWEDNYQHLVEYKQTHHGNCAVKRSYETNNGVALGKWVENQKGAYKRNKLPRDRFEKLEILGVAFAKKASYDIPIDLNEPPPPSAAWISAASSVPSPTKKTRRPIAPAEDNEENDQNNDDGDNTDAADVSAEPSPKKKRRKKAHSASAAVGNKENDNQDDHNKSKKAVTAAVTTPSERSPVIQQRWEQYRQQLISYKTAKGDCNIPSTYKPNQPLAKWVENQRSAYHRTKLSQERTALLQQIGFDFGASKSDRWEFHLEELSKFKQKYKHVGVPQKYRANPGLGRWVMKQKERQRGDRLPLEQFDRLKELGLFE